MSESSSETRPRLPSLLKRPLSALPARLHSMMVAKALGQVFAAEIADGELDFLRGRTVRITVEDAGVAIGLSLQGSRFIAVPHRQPADLTIRGTVYDYLLLIGEREDPDTLFFQRRLGMEGDTDLGVHLKNFLASVEMASLPLPVAIRPLLDRGVSLYERLA